MKQETRKTRSGHITGNCVPYSLRKVCGSLTSLANHVTLKMLETGPTVFRPYPRRLEWYSLANKTRLMRNRSIKYTRRAHSLQTTAQLEKLQFNWFTLLSKARKKCSPC